MDEEKISNVFGIATAAPKNAGLAAIEKREETEVFAMVMMAKRFPRDQQASMDRILTAFARPTLAAVAAYQYARGGTDITGPSIRAAEAMAQEWGNLDTTWSEVGRGKGADGKAFSEVRAHCIDLQSTNRKSIGFIVPHWRDTKSGGYALKDERDIYELCANQAQRRLRACILASIPGDVVDMAMKQAATTLTSTADVSPTAQKALVDAFAQWNVTKEMIEKRIQRRLDTITAAQMVQMKRIYASLRDDMSTADTWFDIAAAQPTDGNTTNLADIAAKAKAVKEGKADKPAAPPPPPPTPPAPPAAKQAPDASLKITYAGLMDRIFQATSMQKVDECADLIAGCTDNQAMRGELQGAVERRRDELEAMG